MYTICTLHMDHRNEDHSRQQLGLHKTISVHAGRDIRELFLWVKRWRPSVCSLKSHSQSVTKLGGGPWAGLFFLFPRTVPQNWESLSLKQWFWKEGPHAGEMKSPGEGWKHTFLYTKGTHEDYRPCGSIEVNTEWSVYPGAQMNSGVWLRVGNHQRAPLLPKHSRRKAGFGTSALPFTCSTGHSNPRSSPFATTNPWRGDGESQQRSLSTWGSLVGDTFHFRLQAPVHFPSYQALCWTWVWQR